ncbi:hypothetical protein BZG36_02816 [Bifiguratus adelaidae]|uniref:Alcohol dehydrogenase-like C-terminal domain-containing protein n=1 Tax=Bifiguratus adelaidae TaxID=1938954 RepID=A0A261Y1E7_9FUNG|nr:hypothetical protein BZG36_02816 [Bifiguratus adelaidae]
MAFLQNSRFSANKGMVKIPKHRKVIESEAACLVFTGVTAWNVLRGANPLKPRKAVLAFGTEGVSLTTIQITTAAEVIITSSSEYQLVMAKSKFGADFGVNYKTHSDW